MNQTSSPPTGGAGGADIVSLLTTVHLAWIALLALIVVAGIVYGARVSRRRKRAEREVHEHAEEAGVAATPPVARGEDEPAVAPPSAAPTDPAPAPAPAGTDAADPAGGPVTQLKGLGPKVAARLGELGVTRVDQLAALDHDAAQALDAQMGPFKGRLERDRWIEQARFLAAGDVKGFEAVFGRL